MVGMLMGQKKADFFRCGIADVVQQIPHSSESDADIQKYQIALCFNTVCISAGTAGKDMEFHRLTLEPGMVLVKVFAALPNLRLLQKSFIVRHHQHCAGVISQNGCNVFLGGQIHIICDFV